jgi:biopolymer transport protein ExbD
MKLKRRTTEEKLEIPITPMIDAVFLLLIFFMVTTTLHRQEADISFALPGVAEQSEPVEMPDEQIIDIYTDGRVVLNSLEYDSPDSRDLPELLRMLQRFRETAEANNVEAMITINPAGDLEHQRVVDVLNACAAANIMNVTFAMEGEM